MYDAERNFMNTFATYTPHILVGVCILTFIIAGVLQFIYYSDAFLNVTTGAAWLFGITIAIVSQCARFALLINGANHYAHDRKTKGGFSIAFSFIVTAITALEMSHLADFWTSKAPEHATTIPLIVQFVIWLGFALEILLVMTVAGSAQNSQKQAHNNSKVFTTGNGVTV